MREQTQFETMPLGIRIGDLSHADIYQNGFEPNSNQ